MTLKARTSLSVLLLATAVLFPAARQAEAATITLFDGTTTLVINDNDLPAPGTNADQNPVLGFVTFTGSIGAWTFTVASGQTKPLTGSEESPEMQLTVSATSVAANPGQLTVSFTETGFGPSSLFGRATLAPGFAPGSVSYEVFQDANSLALISVSGAFPAQTTPVVLPTGDPPYSLTQQVTITQSTPGSTAVVATLTVPDGGVTLSMLGFGLLAMGLLSRRLGLR